VNAWRHAACAILNSVASASRATLTSNPPSEALWRKDTGEAFVQKAQATVAGRND
jgi:hypothetical protein